MATAVGVVLIQVLDRKHHAVLNSPSTSFGALEAGGFFEKERGRLVDGTVNNAWQNEVALRRVGQCHASVMPLRIAALFVLAAVLFLCPFAGEARAHGLHPSMTVQMPANWAESTVSQDGAVSAQTACGVNCCSTTGCAVAVLNAAHPDIVFVAIDDGFVFPRNTVPRPSPQSSLKRPPRA